MAENKARKDGAGLLPSLGFFTTLSIVVGAVIGSGIFKKPAIMADTLASPELMIFVWALAGVITLFGALSNAEVASIIPETGGQYIYFEKMYGRFFSFLYGWSLLAVIQTASIASIAYVFGEYSQEFSAFQIPRFSEEIEKSFRLSIPFIGTFYPWANIGVKIITCCTIILLSTVNYMGVIFGGKVSDLFTSAKVLAILILIGFSFTYTGGATANLSGDAPGFSDFDWAKIFGAVVAALSAAFWAYDGWNNITYIAGEVKKPQKNIPMALFIGTIVIVAVYILINLAFLYVVPVDVMSGQERIAAYVANITMGGVGAGFISAAVMISTFGTTNGTIMVSARVYYAMARHGLFYPAIGKTQEKYRTPGNALILQAVIACLYVFSGTFDDLTDTLIFVSWIFYAMGALGVFILRKKMKDVPRPYKVWGYPFTPAIFILFAACFVGATLYNDIINYTTGKKEIITSFLGILLVMSGIPFYIYFTKKNKTP